VKQPGRPTNTQVSEGFANHNTGGIRDFVKQWTIDERLKYLSVLYKNKNEMYNCNIGYPYIHSLKQYLPKWNWKKGNYAKKYMKSVKNILKNMKKNDKYYRVIKFVFNKGDLKKVGKGKAPVNPHESEIVATLRHLALNGFAITPKLFNYVSIVICKKHNYTNSVTDSSKGLEKKFISELTETNVFRKSGNVGWIPKPHWRRAVMKRFNLRRNFNSKTTVNLLDILVQAEPYLFGAYCMRIYYNIEDGIGNILNADQMMLYKFYDDRIKYSFGYQHTKSAIINQTHSFISHISNNISNHNQKFDINSSSKTAFSGCPVKHILAYLNIFEQRLFVSSCKSLYNDFGSFLYSNNDKISIKNHSTDIIELIATECLHRNVNATISSGKKKKSDTKNCFSSFVITNDTGYTKQQLIIPTKRQTNVLSKKDQIELNKHDINIDKYTDNTIISINSSAWWNEKHSQQFADILLPRTQQNVHKLINIDHNRMHFCFVYF